MNLHLSTNFMLREIFELPPPLPAMDPTNASKMSKTERVSTNIFPIETNIFHVNFQNAANQLAFKLRTQTRNKNRDKRSAVV